jgi:hypothetical protein
VQGKITGVINAGNEFMRLVQEMGSEISKQAAADGLLANPPPRPPTPPVADLAAARARRAQKPQEKTAPWKLSSAADRLLKALSRYPKASLRWRDVCVVCGMAYGNGFYYGGRKELLEQGLVEETDSDRARITPAGLQRVAGGAHHRPPTRAEVITTWSAKLKAPAAEMLQLLAKDPTRHWSTEDFAAALNLKPGNGHWYGGLSGMRENGLIEQDMPIRLSAFMNRLFPSQLDA